MTDALIVETSAGRVHGVRRGAVSAFLGVPFAAAPVGGLRFREPVPHPGWSGVRDAADAGGGCPQGVSRLAAVMGTPDEDHFAEENCLTVNVWTPDTTGRAPVLFWIHGGAWASGSAGWSWYDGSRLAAEQGIVVVSASYRLGPLGYLYLADAVQGHGSGNFGLLDQQAALGWTVANVAAFGGDPQSITVGGQSGGAHSSALLAALPHTRPHVRRVLLQSGPGGLPGQPVAQAAEIATHYLDTLGIRGNESRLRELPADDLVSAYGRLSAQRARFGSVAPALQPVADLLVPDGGMPEALNDGATDELDVMLGWTRDEASAFFLADTAAVDRADVIGALTEYGDDPEKLYEEYAAQRPDATPADVLNDIVTDKVFRLPALDMAEKRAARGNPAFVYRFDWSASAFGACHCVDVPFLFGNLDAWRRAPMLGAADRASLNGVAKVLTAAVGSFIRTGRPDAPDVPEWRAYRPGTCATMRFDTISETAADVNGPQHRTFRERAATNREKGMLRADRFPRNSSTQLNH